MYDCTGGGTVTDARMFLIAMNPPLVSIINCMNHVSHPAEVREKSGAHNHGTLFIVFFVVFVNLRSTEFP